jgi:hypothetical protein
MFNAAFINEQEDRHGPFPNSLVRFRMTTLVDAFPRNGQLWADLLARPVSHCSSPCGLRQQITAQIEMPHRIFTCN